MASLTEVRPAGSFLVWEEEADYSRENIVVLMGEVLDAGTLIGVDSAGKWKSSDPGAADGSEVVAGVLFAAVDATTADTPAVAIVRNAVVNKNIIVFDAAINTDPLKEDAIAQLKTAGIVVR